MDSVKVSISLPKELLEKIDTIARRGGWKRSTIIRIALEEFLTKIEKEGEIKIKVKE